MCKKTILPAILLAVLPGSIPATAQPLVLPAETKSLIELIDAETGKDPELLYQWLMTRQSRPKDDAADPKLRLAVERLMKRSSGMTLKFAVSRWESMSYYQKEVLSADQVDFVLNLIENKTFMTLTEKDWERKLPYRFRFSQPTRILSRSLTNETEMIMAKIDDANPAVRASAITILNGRVLYRFTVDDARIAPRLIELADDDDMNVRAAVAMAMGNIKVDKPRKFVDVLRVLADDKDASVRWNALYSTRTLAEYITADHAAELVADVPRRTMRDCQMIVSAIEAITKHADQAACDKIIETALPLMNSKEVNVRSRIIEILAFAAVSSSQQNRDQSVHSLSRVIAASDDFDEMNAINDVSPLAGKLSAHARSQLIDELLKVIEAPGATHVVRMRQAAAAAANFVPFLNDDAKRNVTTRMLAILKRPKKRRPATVVIGAAGPQGIAAVDQITALTTHRDPWVRLVAARALWKIQPSVETCSAVYLQVLHNGPDVARYTARLGLLEMKHDAITVLDDLIELLDNKRADSHALEVISHLGPDAAKAVDHVKPFLHGQNLPVVEAAQRALKSFEAANAKDH